MEIKMLTGEDCLKTRALWEEVFVEDSEQFTDYYFENKAKDNIGYVMGSEPYRAMMFRTPYDMQIGDKRKEISYIVGVATKKEYRHKGLMTALLMRAFQDMYKKKEPFAFLMPANPAIYEPFDFSYIYEKEIWRLVDTSLILALESFMERPEYEITAKAVLKAAELEPSNHAIACEKPQHGKSCQLKSEETQYQHGKSCQLKCKEAQYQKSCQLKREEAQQGKSCQQKSEEAQQGKSCQLKCEEAQQGKSCRQKSEEAQHGIGLLQKWERENKLSLVSVGSILGEDNDGGIFSKLADFANSILQARYEIYVHRDEKYYERLWKELRAQNGDIFLTVKDNRIRAIFLYAREGDEISIQEVLQEEEGILSFLQKEEKKKPLIMARIIHLEEMLKLVRSKEKKSMLLEVEDPLIAQNEGYYRIEITPKGSIVTRLMAPRPAEESLSVGRLAPRLLQNVFINEIV